LESDLYFAVNFLLISHFDVSIASGVLILIFLLAATGFTSASETAFFSLSLHDNSMLKTSGKRIDRLVLQLLESPERIVATTLTMNIILNTGFVVMAFFITNRISVSIPQWVKILLQIAVITLIILFCSEVLPRLFSGRYSISLSRYSAPVINLFNKIFWPVNSFLIHSTLIINKRLAKHAENISMDKLTDILSSDKPGMSEEKNILEGIVKFSNSDVCDIMRSRVDTVAVEIKTGFNDLLKIINGSGYSRIPVYDHTFDHIKGILYVKDLLPYIGKSDGFKWQQLMRPPYFVPESKKINNLLKEFQTNRIHMAIVVDEYGGTSGIVTLEDILEEIVGEITDESDIEPQPYEKIDNYNYIFEGKIPLNDFYKVLGLEDGYFDNVRGDADTLAGLILELRGEIPQKDDMISFKNLGFTIISADKRRINKIKITIKPLIRK